MRGVLCASVLLVVVFSVSASTIQMPQTPGDFDETSYTDASQTIPEIHGSRMKRSPLDPAIAPLLVAKSFLYGALIGPKLFHRPRYYYHPKPHFYHHHPYAHGWGYGK